MTNTKIIKSNKYSLTEMNPIQLRVCPLTLLCTISPLWESFTVEFI